MRLSKYIHSCLLTEKAADKILFDPGKFSCVEGAVSPEHVQALSVIVITHFHLDHIDEDALEKIPNHIPSAVVLSHAQAQQQIAQKGISTEVFEMDTRFLPHDEPDRVGDKHGSQRTFSRPREFKARAIAGVNMCSGRPLKARRIVMAAQLATTTLQAHGCGMIKKSK
jgi:L-ascorbate metabolism protein UlaG (beta-lactamase superfamily)